MVDEIGSQGLYSVGITEDRRSSAALAFLLSSIGVVAGPVFRAPGVVVFDLLQLVVVEQYLGRPAFVDDAHGDLVGHRFGHGVGVHHLAEDIQRRIDRRAGEADIGRVRQRVVQVSWQSRRSASPRLR